MTTLIVLLNTMAASPFAGAGWTGWSGFYRSF